MNNRIILLSLLILTFVLPTLADYNITCERSCTLYTDPTCTGYSQQLAYDNTHVWSYNRQAIGDNTNRSKWIITPDSDYGSYSSCNFYEYTTGGSGGCTGTCWYNYTFGLINGSSITPDSWICTNESADNSLCDNLGGDKRNLWWEAIIYDSSDGTCSGNQVLSWNIANGNCQTDFYIAPGQDVHYRYWSYDFAQGTDCYYSTGATTSNTIGTQELYDCDVSCDGTAYAFYYNVDVINGTTTTSYIQNFAGNHTYESCDAYGQECLQYGIPINTTLQAGCNCIIGQTDYGITCDGTDCYRTCSGSLDSQTFINESEQTSNILLSGNPIEFIQAQGRDVTGFFAGVVPQLIPIVWWVIILIVLFAVVTWIITLFTDGLSR